MLARESDEQWLRRLGVGGAPAQVGFTLLASTEWSGGDRASLTPAGLVCENNRLHDFGRWVYTYQAGAHVAGVGVTIRKVPALFTCAPASPSFAACTDTLLLFIPVVLVSNRLDHVDVSYAGTHEGSRVDQNLFFGGFHVAILFGGNDHLFELNEIRNVATVGYDTGAVYGGRDLSSRVSTPCLPGVLLFHRSIAPIAFVRGTRRGPPFASTSFITSNTPANATQKHRAYGRRYTLMTFRGA